MLCRLWFYGFIYTSVLFLILNDLEKLAKVGSENAAEKLYNYCIEKNQVQAEYCLRIAAQNGNINCIRKYIEVLKKNSDKKDNLRVKFWEQL